jgi:hypothetical protein
VTSPWSPPPTTRAKAPLTATAAFLPYAETQGYVKRIREMFKRDEHPYDPSRYRPVARSAQNRLPQADVTTQWHLTSAECCWSF